MKHLKWNKKKIQKFAQEIHIQYIIIYFSSIIKRTPNLFNRSIAVS